MRRALLAAAALLLAPGPAAGQDLGALIAAAEANHPVLRGQKTDILVAAEDVAGARAAYRPSITARASVIATERDALLQNGGTFERDDTQQSASIALDQTLYDGGRRSLRNQVAALRLRAAKLRYEQARREIALSVAADYYALRAAKDAVRLNRDLEALLEEDLRAAIARERAGDASQTDIATTRSRLSLAKSQSAAAALDRQVAQFGLLSATGLSIVEESADVAAPACEVAAGDEGVREIVRADPSVRLAAVQTAIAKADSLSAKRANAPTVSLAARASTAREVSPVIDENDELTLGVSITVPLYRGGAGASAKRRSIAALRGTASTESEARRQAELRARQLFARLDAGRAALAAQQARLAAASVAADGIRVGEGVGFYSALDVLDALGETVAAEIAFASASADYDLTRHTLCVISGADQRQ